MNKLAVIKSVVKKTVISKGFLLKKHSPEILIIVGSIGLFTSGILAYKATLKIDSLVDEAQDNLKRIKDGKDGIENYTSIDAQKDTAIVYVQTGVKIAKAIAPAVILGVVSVSCILGAHNIMKGRNLALAAAYKALDGSFRDYRRRVRDELGPIKDREYKTGIREETVTEMEKDAKGKERAVTKKINRLDPNQYSSYARYFNEECEGRWNKTPEYNLIFLKTQQNFANDMLQVQGHLFLNEVYDMLGIERSKAGAVVGWVMDKGNDNFVDFGLFDIDSKSAQDFINGRTDSVLLDFNVDGVIYDLI